MSSLTEPTPQSDERESNLRPILLGIALVVVLVGIIAIVGRESPKTGGGLPPYASNIRFSDLKMSAAENFVGASVTYLDGTVTNTGDKTVSHLMIHIVFKDTMGQTVQMEDMPVRVVETVGPYPDAVDLNIAPLAPTKSKPFRVTFEHVASDWNREYPALQVTDITLK